MSVIQDFARDYLGAVIGFGQVFLASGILVAVAYGLKSRLLPERPEPIARKPKNRKPRRQKPATKAKTRSTAAPAADPKPKTEPEPVRFIPASTPEASASPPSISPALLDTHWQRAIEALHLSIERAEKARELHERALVRLDSADYAFQRMLIDLVDVISPPQQQTTSPAQPPASKIPERPTRRLAA